MPRSKKSHSRDFKLMAVARYEECKNAAALARELGISRFYFYRWKRELEIGGEAALNPGARAPESSAAMLTRKRVAELERKIGRQQVELDFFRAALQQVGAPRRKNGGRGGPASTQ